MDQAQKTLLIQWMRGDVTPDQAIEALGVSRRVAKDLLRRYLQSKLPRAKDVVNAPVDQPVSVLRDRWGVAHVEAQSVGDCFTALGYAMAQDRLWQMDYMRRLAHGRLAEVLGANWLPQDRLHRTLGLTRSARQAASVMTDDVKMVLQSLAGGINAWIEQVGDRLPVEFELLNDVPEPWTVVDSIAIWKWRWWMLTGRLGMIAVGEAAKRHLPPDLLDLFLSIEAGEDTIVPGDEPAGIGGFDTGEGSNNWVVGGSLTINGKPVLATDPHNEVGLSRQWYQAQVTAPGMDAIGAFFLGTPGIYLGHTRHTAWGVTNHTASVRDLYVEDVSADDAKLYRDGDTWRPFEMDRQEIPVRGEPPDVYVIQRTVRGPVMNAFVPSVDEGPQPILSMRWIGNESTTGFEAMLMLMRSQSVAEVEAALEQWPMPILNFVYADDAGRIGYHAVGHVPTRKAQAVGFRPANDPDHVWGAPFAFHALPKFVDPECNWVATANNPPWGGRGPYMSLGSWSDGYRFRRIQTRITERAIHDMESVGAIHADVTHGRALDLASKVAEIAMKAKNKRLRELGGLLGNWDGAYSVDSVAATVFTAFWELWLRRVTSVRFPESMLNLVAPRAGGVARRVLLHDAPGWFVKRVDIEKEVRETLVETLSWLRKEIGVRKSQWRWGRLHTVTFRHPMSNGGMLSEILDVGPFETSGGTGTVRAAGYAFGKPFEVAGLSTYRMVVDLADTAHALSTAAGGQSGHPGSAHYRTQSELWVADHYHPLLMDRADVEANLENMLIVNP